MNTFFATRVCHRQHVLVVVGARPASQNNRSVFTPHRQGGMRTRWRPPVTLSKGSWWCAKSCDFFQRGATKSKHVFRDACLSPTTCLGVKKTVAPHRTKTGRFSPLTDKVSCAPDGDHPRHFATGHGGVQKVVIFFRGCGPKSEHVFRDACLSPTTCLGVKKTVAPHRKTTGRFSPLTKCMSCAPDDDHP